MKSWSHRTILQYHWWLAGAMLVLMFGLGFASMRGNSAIVDELAHVPAAYSYVHYGDYRLNPEHPPLMKDLAGIPLQFLPLKFPDTIPAWTTQVNGQWDMGWNFLYYIGNNPDTILFWARLPILLVAVGFGLWLYWFCRRRWGVAVALVTLLFYALSPNILAHAALVTTDLGAAVFCFIAVAAFGLYIEKPSWKRFWWLSLALGLAQVAKFSAIQLYPLLGLMAVVFAVVRTRPANTVERFKQYVGGFIGASVASVGWIWLVYAPQTWNMPGAVQDRLISGVIYFPEHHWIITLLTSLNDLTFLKPIVQYALGVVMVLERVAGGNVTYLNGVVTDQSFFWYFPELFAVKTQVALLVLMVVAVAVAVRRGKLSRLSAHVAKYPLEWSLGVFAVFYFVVAIKGNLNLGIRHVLPIYIPLFVLVAVASVKLWRRLQARAQWRMPANIGGTVLLTWYAASTVLVAPFFIPYFNELIGGPAKADAYFSDSSVDWGQDMLRLKTYLKEHPEIDKLALDYFGGAIVEHYFCDRTYDANGVLIATAAGYDCSKSPVIAWHSQNGPYTGQYIAVSETYLESDRWYSAVNGTPSYDYLRAMQPIAKIGYSIYLYKLY